MCGIAGYYGQGDKGILKNMCDSLVHRGPDNEGFFVERNVGLGQRRLSIIDLSPTGHQPMCNEDKTVWISFNGEVYNFMRLRDMLKGSHHFRGTSDTEVILHLYEEIGEKVFGLLEGMFAIALYDTRSRALFLARDRMGKKPLYYGLFGDTLIFASELKALRAHPVFENKLSKLALKSYLFHECVPTPLSIYENIYKLEPASYIKYLEGMMVKKKFWDISFERGPATRPSLDEATKLLDVALEESVKDRLVSDAPLGVLLSGGLDSSAVLYYAQKNSSSKINTFSIGFREASYDESGYARRVAAHLGSEHHEEILEANDCLPLIAGLGKTLDEPMADQSILPTLLLSRFTRQHVTVALGGDGGDEVLGGYVTFVAHRLAEYYGKLPRLLRQGFLEKALQKLPTSHSYLSLDFRIKTFLRGFEGDKCYRDARWMSSFDLQRSDEIFNPDIREEMRSHNELQTIDAYARIFGEDLSSGGFERYFRYLTLLYLRIYMMDQVMVKADRASMANSLETRAPFLDSRVVDLALSLPVNYKLHPGSLPYGFETKYVLRKLMQDKLPNDIVWRPKKGFGIPMAQWLSGPLLPLLEEKLNRKRIEEQGLFDSGYIDKLIKEHIEKKKDNRKPLWTLLVFQIWWDEWMS